MFLGDISPPRGALTHRSTQCKGTRSCRMWAAQEVEGSGSSESRA